MKNPFFRRISNFFNLGSPEYRKKMRKYKERLKNARNIKEWLEIRKERQKFKKSFWNDDNVLGWNLYEAETKGEFNRKFHFFHYVLKYKIVVPTLKIFKRWIDNKLGEFSIPNRPYNKNIFIFEDAYEEAKDIWTKKYFCGGDKTVYETKGKQLDKNKELMDTIIKDGYMRLAIQDSAYREFHNVLMHCIADKMMKAYGGRKIRHVFYGADNVYDVGWYMMTNYFDADVKLKTPRGNYYAKRV